MKTLMLVLALTVLVACNKKEESDSIIVVPEISAFVGSWTKCHAVTGKGTVFGATSSYRIQFVINSDATYSHNRWYYSDSATCTGAENSIQWSQRGTVDVLVDSASVSGAKEVAFHTTSTYVTVRNYGAGKLYYDLISNGYALGWVASGSTLSNPDAPFANNNGGQLVMNDFEGLSFIAYNTISVSGTTMSMKEPLDWEIGLVSAPASQDYNLTKY